METSTTVRPAVNIAPCRASVRVLGRIPTLPANPVGAALRLAERELRGPFRTIVVYGLTKDEAAREGDALRRDGWWLTPHNFGTWTSARRDGIEILIGLADAMQPGIHDQLFALGKPARKGNPAPPAIDHDELERRLADYLVYTGRPWYGTATISAMMQLKAQIRADGVEWHHKGPRVADYGHALTWQAPAATPAPKHAGPIQLHSWDGTSAYLGAASGALIAAGPLEYNAGNQFFDPERAGWWRIRPPERLQLAARLNVVPPAARIGRDGAVTATTALVRYLETAHGPIDVIESWTAPGRRLLRPWAEHLRNALVVARSHDDTALVGALKATYRSVVGGMSSELKMPIERPDWTAAIVDQWRSTLLRRIDAVQVQVDLWPHKVQTDSLSYLADDEHAACISEALGVGLFPGRIGSMRYTGATEVAQ